MWGFVLFQLTLPPGVHLKGGFLSTFTSVFVNIWQDLCRVGLQVGTSSPYVCSPQGLYIFWLAHNEPVAIL